MSMGYTHANYLRPGLLRPNPTLQEPRQRGQPLLLEGHGPHAGGYGFCLDAQAMDSLCRGRAKA